MKRLWKWILSLVSRKPQNLKGYTTEAPKPEATKQRTKMVHFLHSSHIQGGQFTPVKPLYYLGKRYRMGMHLLSRKGR